MPLEPHWTAYVTALLTPVVAVMAASIAYRQWRIAQNKLKLDLFDRRFAVYHAARDFLASVMASGRAKDPDVIKFVMGTREAKWLLNNDVAEYLDKQIYHKALDLQRLEAELEGVGVGPVRTKKVQEQSEIKKWFVRQCEVLDQKFDIFLRLEH